MTTMAFESDPVHAQKLKMGISTITHILSLHHFISIVLMLVTRDLSPQNPPIRYLEVFEKCSKLIMHTFVLLSYCFIHRKWKLG